MCTKTMFMFFFCQKQSHGGGLKPAISLKKACDMDVFLLNFAKFLRTLIYIEHLRWLLLYWLITDFKQVFSHQIGHQVFAHKIGLVLTKAAIYTRSRKQWLKIS